MAHRGILWHTVHALPQRTANQKAMQANPHELAAKLVRMVKERLANQLASGNRYQRIDKWYDRVQLYRAGHTPRAEVMVRLPLTGAWWAPVPTAAIAGADDADPPPETFAH